MSKRIADKQLTHDNWDVEDSGDEEPGQFQLAAEEVLKGRVIKKARRRVNRTDGSGATPSASPFAGFAGFGAGTAKPAGGAANPFGFLAAVAKSSPAPAQQSSPDGTKSPPPVGAGSPVADRSTPASMSSPVLPRPPLRSPSSGSASSGSASSGSAGSGSAEYHRQLQALNRSMLSWLQTHMDSNPLCILTPVFRDYEKHLATIERRFGPAAAAGAAAADAGETAADRAVAASPPAASAGFSFGLPKGKAGLASSATPTTSTGFSFGVPQGKTGMTSSTTPTSSTGFSFGLPQGKAGITSSTTPTTSTGFSFGLSKDTPTPASSTAASGTAGFSFGFQSGSQGGGAAPNPTEGEPQDESDEPPVPVVSTVKEDDAVYSKRCKLFYKKDGSFVEKGVGMLYLKPCSDKFQCLIRADTNLGNILLNIKLSKSMPTQRMGKNNVMMACVPNPPLDPKKEADTTPVPLLIRVKTADDADELLQKIDDHKR